MTVRIPVELAENLEELTGYTERSKSFLAAKAITAYVAHELNICRMIQEGIDDIEAGRVHDHEDVMADAMAIIESKRAKRKVG